MAPLRWRKRRIPALCGGGIERTFRGGAGLRNPAATEQPCAVVEHSGLSGGDAEFRLGKAHPIAVPGGGNGRSEGAHLHADASLILAEPIPLGDSHRLHGQRTARPHDNLTMLRLDADDVKRFRLAADPDSPALPDGEL